MQPSQERVLAAAAITTQIDAGDHRFLGGARRPRSSAQALRILRDRYDLLSGEAVKHAIAALLARTDHVGWCSARAAAIAGLAYRAYLLDLKPAWRRMKAAARQAVGASGSWRDFAGDVVASTRTLNRRDLDDTRAAVDALLEGPDSPWKHLAWDTRFDEARAPLRVPRTWVVGGAGNEVRTITPALALAVAGDRILVKAGTYRENLVVRTSVELVAEGEVVLDGGTDDCITVKTECTVVVSGFTLRSKDGCAQVTRGYLRVERCDVHGERMGLAVSGKDALLSVARCRIHDASSRGVNALGGALASLERSRLVHCEDGLFAADRPTTVSIERCRVLNGRLQGIHVATGRLVVRDTVVRGHGRNGLWLVASQRGTIDRSTFDRCLPGILLSNARAMVTDTVVRGGKEGGLFCAGKSGGQFLRCVFEKNAFSGVEVVEESNVTLLECILRDNATDGLLAQKGGRALLSRCSIERSGQSGVRQAGGSEVVLDRVTIEDTGNSAIACAGSRCMAADCAFVRSGANGVELGADATVALVGTRVADTRPDEEALTTGFLVMGGTLEASRCILEGNPCGMMIKDGAASLVECVVAGGADGILAAGGNLRAERCEVTRATNVGVQIYDGADPLFEGCSVHDDNAAVLAYDGGRGRFVGGHVGPSTKDETLDMQSGARVVFQGVALAGGPAGVLKTDGAEAVLESCAEQEPDVPVPPLARAPFVERFGRALQTRFPALYDTFQPGLRSAELDDLEGLIRRPLGFLRDLLAWRDGQREPRSVLHNQYFLSAAAIVETCRELDALLDTGDLEAGAWSKSWVPFLANGAGDHVCLVTEGSPGRRPGEILEFRHDDAERPVEGTDLESWLDGWTVAFELGLMEKTSTGVHPRYEGFLRHRQTR